MPRFKNEKLIDIIRRYPDVFELVPDTIKGHPLVRLQPGAQAALLDADEIDARITREAMLPERIELPITLREKMQCLRIELVHGLHRRGGRSPLQEEGHQPGEQVERICGTVHAELRDLDGSHHTWGN